MATTIEGTERVYLGKLISIAAGAQPAAELPPALPTSSPAAIENVYNYQVGPTTTQGSEGIAQMRFHLIEVEIIFQGADSWTSMLVTPYMSRINPAPKNYGVTEDVADTWGSFGGQMAYKVSSANGGNRFRFAAACAKYLFLWGSGGSGGSGARTADALLYGITERGGGIS